MLRSANLLWWAVLLAIGFGLSSCARGGLRAPSREFSGVWLYEFEGSTFVEGAREIPADRPRYRDTDWLDPDQRLYEAVEVDWGDAGNTDCHEILPLRVTFIGHRVHNPIAGAGHLGLWRSLVVAEDTISVERLGPPFCYE